MNQKFGEFEMLCTGCGTRFEVLKDGVQVGQFKCPDCERDFTLADLYDFKIGLTKSRLMMRHLKNKMIVHIFLGVVAAFSGIMSYTARDIPIVSWVVLMLGVLIILICALATYMLSALVLPEFNQSNSVELSMLHDKKRKFEQQKKPVLSTKPPGESGDGF